MNFLHRAFVLAPPPAFRVLTIGLFGAALLFSCASVPKGDSKKNNSVNFTNPTKKETQQEAEKRKSEERWQRELERRREQKRQEKLEAERQREKERLALLKKQEEERKRAEEAAAKKKQEELERERQRRAEEERRRAEEKRKAEEARRKKRERIARKIKEFYEGGSFWAKDASRLVQGHILAESSGKGQAALFQNPLRLQLQGLSYTQRRYALKLGDPIPIKKGQFDLTPLLLAKRGNFLLLQINANFFQERPAALRSQLFRIRLQGRDWNLLNIYSDGEDLLRLDLESADDRRDYHRVLVEELLLSP